MTPDIFTPIPNPGPPGEEIPADTPAPLTPATGDTGENGDITIVEITAPPEEITEVVPGDSVAAGIIRVHPTMPVVRIRGHVRITGSQGPEPVTAATSRIGICTAMAACLASHPGAS